MKKITTNIIFAFVLLLLLNSCKDKPSLPSLRETYSFNDKNPFGSNVLYRQLNQFFYHNNLNVVKKNISKNLSSNYDTSSLYVIVSKNLFITADERNSMMNFVSNGNDLFIACEYIDTAFLNDIKLKPGKEDPFVDFLTSMNYTSVNLHPSTFYDSSSFAYYYIPFNNSFYELPPGSKVLGRNQNGDPNFIVVFYGKGRFYIHCDPRAFSNYFLLQKENYKYVQYAFSFMPEIPEHIYWDDFYNKRNSPPHEDGSKSGFSVLLQYPAMAWAFWLVFSLLLLFILFNGKRRQRIIKPLQPNTNTSVAFTETVGRLYLQKKDNRNIADKMITYFLEQVRNQYFLNTGQLSEDFTDTLSRKSNVPLPQTEKLISTIKEIQQSADISDQQVLSLNQQIENFYKHKS